MAEKETTEETPGITEEDIQARIDEALGDVNKDIDSIKKEFEQKEEPRDPEKSPWEQDPKYQATSYNEFVGELEKHLVRKGYTPTNVDEITNQVAERLVTAQKKVQETEQAQMEEANKVIDQELAELKKDDSTVNENELFSFINTWNQTHKTKIQSVKEGYEIMRKADKPKQEEKKETRIAGASGGDEAEAPKIKRGTDPWKVVAEVLNEFEG